MYCGGRGEIALLHGPAVGDLYMLAAAELTGGDVGLLISHIHGLSTGLCDELREGHGLGSSFKRGAVQHHKGNELACDAAHLLPDAACFAALVNALCKLHGIAVRSGEAFSVPGAEHGKVPVFVGGIVFLCKPLKLIERIQEGCIFFNCFVGGKGIEGLVDILIEAELHLRSVKGIVRHNHLSFRWIFGSFDSNTPAGHNRVHLL